MAIRVRKIQRLVSALSFDDAKKIFGMIRATAGPDAGKDMTQILGIETEEGFEQSQNDMIAQEKMRSWRYASQLGLIMLGVGIVYRFDQTVALVAGVIVFLLFFSKVRREDRN